MKRLESQKRVSSLFPAVDIILSELPIVINQKGSHFEIWSGTHRIMCLIKKGIKSRKVLLVQDNFDNDCLLDVFFKD